MLGLPLLAAGCGALSRPYEERRQWPLRVARPQSVPPRIGGVVLLVRNVQAGPGLNVRGLQSLQPDGSIRTAFYEEWLVPPAEAVDASLRLWLASAGIFAAVVLPGSRATADFVLESELTALWTVPAEHVARAALGVSVIDQRGGTNRVVRQFVARGVADLTGDDTAAGVVAQGAALAAAFGQVETELRAVVA